MQADALIRKAAMSARAVKAMTEVRLGLSVHSNPLLCTSPVSPP